MVKQKMIEIEEVEELWELDSQIDVVRLDTASLDVPKLHNKYTKIHNKVKLESLKLEAKYNDMQQIKTLYYSGKLSKEELDEKGWEPHHIKVLRNDMKSYIESDPDLMKIKIRIDYYTIMYKYLESIISQINNRSFLISNSIKWKQWQSGQ
jgi:hypothetical protein